MDIQIDTREKDRAIEGILQEFDHRRVRHFSSKLYVGDYMSLDNARLVVDRKANLNELVGNLGSDKSRFYKEVQRAKQFGIKLIVLCEHGQGIKSIQDVGKWENPILQKYPAAMTGRDLMERLYRLHISYGVEILFCDKQQTGQRIIELLGGDAVG